MTMFPALVVPKVPDYFVCHHLIFSEAKVYDLVVIIMTMFPALVVPKVPDYFVNPKKIVSLLLGR